MATLLTMRAARSKSRARSSSQHPRRGRQASRSRSRSRAPSQSEDHAKEPEAYAYRGLRSRSELLATRVMDPDEFFRVVKNYGPNGPMNVGEKLKPIAVVLRPNETTSRYEENFQQWLKSRKVSVASLRDDPEEERRYRQCFAYVRANTAAPPPARRREEEDGRALRQRSPSRARKRSPSRDPNRGEILKKSRLEEQQRLCVEKEDAEELRYGQEWADKMTQKVAQLEDQVNRRFQELEREMEGLKGRGGAGKGAHAAASSSTAYEVPRVHVKQPTIQSVAVVPNVSKSTSHNLQQNILNVATDTARKAARVHSDPAQKRLVKDYTRLSSQIVMNETALEDSLAYVRTLEGTGEEEAAEHLSQTKELKLSIENEKQRRDTALAAAIAQEWKGKQEQFDRLVQHLDQTGSAHASHELLTEIYSKLGQNGEEVGALQCKLKNRLSWLSAGDVGKDAHFQELEELSTRLAAVLSERVTLDMERGRVCLQLVRANEALYNLTVELIEEAHLWLS